VIFGIKGVQEQLRLTHLLVLVHCCSIKLHHLRGNREWQNQGKRLN